MPPRPPGPVCERPDSDRSATPRQPVSPRRRQGHASDVIACQRTLGSTSCHGLQQVFAGCCRSRADGRQRSDRPEPHAGVRVPGPQSQGRFGLAGCPSQLPKGHGRAPPQACIRTVQQANQRIHRVAADSGEGQKDRVSQRIVGLRRRFDQRRDRGRCQGAKLLQRRAYRSAGFHIVLPKRLDQGGESRFADPRQGVRRCPPIACIFVRQHADQRRNSGRGAGPICFNARIASRRKGQSRRATLLDQRGNRRLGFGTQPNQRQAGVLLRPFVVVIEQGQQQRDGGRAVFRDRFRSLHSLRRRVGRLDLPNQAS